MWRMLTAPQLTIKPMSDPRALSSVLGATMRIAQRMGIHDENVNSTHPALEAELRRRLWWSLMLFDARISEMTDFKLSTLLPTWDCRLPSNTNDFDYRTEMRLAPEAHGVTSEALFAVVRAEFGDFIRHCSFHLDFINPALKKLARNYTAHATNLDELTVFERKIEEKYLQYCDPHNPLHFMTIWWARGQLAKHRFVKDLSEDSKVIAARTDEQRDTSNSNALTMIECDTQLMSSELTTGCRWAIYLNFPFPAYVQAIQDLRKRPFSRIAERAWDIMSDNCTARFMNVDYVDTLMGKKENPFFTMFSSVVLQAWSVREAAIAERGLASTGAVPSIVTQIKTRLASAEGEAASQGDPTTCHVGTGPSSVDSSMLPGMNVGSAYSSNEEVSVFGSDPFAFTFPQQSMGFGVDAPIWGWPSLITDPLMGQGW
jgi:hypothetical protein